MPADTLARPLPQPPSVLAFLRWHGSCCLAPVAMRSGRRIPALVLAAVALFVPAAARADDAGVATTGAENINGATANPRRFLYESSICRTCAATEVTNDPRAQNLNPEGINFSDCEQNLRMDFSLAISGFSAMDDAAIQIGPAPSTARSRSTGSSTAARRTRAGRSPTPSVR